MSSSSWSHAVRRQLAIAASVAFASLGLCASASPAAAVVGSVNDSPITSNGNVNAIAKSADRVYFGGTFTRIGLKTPFGADLSGATGIASPTFARPGAAVTAVVSDGARGWYVGGNFTSFTTAAGVTVTRNRLAHLLADGSLDPSFDPNIADGTVNALALSGGTLFAGGTFTSVNGTLTRRRAAAFSTTTGVATSFDPNVLDGAVKALAVSGGMIFAGGTFTTVNDGGAIRNRLGAFSTLTGAVTGFDPNIVPGAAETSPAAVAVNALGLSGNRLFAGGSFTRVNGSPGVVRSRLAAFDITGAGAVDPAFDAGLAPSSTDSASSEVVNALVIGDSIYIGGTFTTVGRVPVRTRGHLAALSVTDGTSDGPLDPNVNGPVMSLALANNTLYVGGSFSAVGLGSGTQARNNLAAYNVISGLQFPTNMDGDSDAPVAAVAAFQERVYAGGDFGWIGPDTARNRLAALDLTSNRIDPAFDPNVGGAGSGTSVNAIVATGDAVYAGGSFSTVNGSLARGNLAAFDVDAGDAVPSFAPIVNSSGASVRALALSGTTLYVGGRFSTVRSSPSSATDIARRCLAAFDVTGDGTPTSFDQGCDGDSSVLALSALGPTLYAGGTFASLGGVTRHGIASFDTPTGQLTPFDPDITSTSCACAGTVNAIVASGSRVYAAGSFDAIKGNPGRDGLAAFDPSTGALDSGFTTNLDGSGNALALTQNTLYVGGLFAALHADLAAVNATTGAADGAFAPPSTPIGALYLAGARLYAGEASVSGAPPRGVDRFTGPPIAPGAITLPATSPSPTSPIVTLNAVVNPNDLATGYAFEYGTSTSFGSVTPTDLAGSDTNPLVVSATPAGLLANTQYFYRVAATNSAGTTNGTVKTFTTPSPAPAVVTGAASSVTNTGASVAGTVNPNGAATAYVFEYGSSTSLGSITTVTAAGTGSATLGVSASLSGLAPGSRYYYRLVATNAQGATTFGSVMTFTTPGSTAAPTAVTGAASAITSTTATLAGTVDPSGRSVRYVFEYGTSTSFGSISAIGDLPADATPDPVTVSLAGLSTGTTYFYRLVATNASTTSMGAVHSFTTAGTGNPPTVVTGSAIAVTATGATLNGTVNPNGEQANCVFEYGTTTSFGSIGSVVPAGAGTSAVAVTSTLTGLTPDTTYLYRIVASNSTSTVTGAVMSFTTPAAA